jgi:hypothetical protein
MKWFYQTTAWLHNEVGYCRKKVTIAYRNLVENSHGCDIKIIVEEKGCISNCVRIVCSRITSASTSTRFGILQLHNRLR